MYICILYYTLQTYVIQYILQLYYIKTILYSIFLFTKLFKPLDIYFGVLYEWKKRNSGYHDWAEVFITGRKVKFWVFAAEIKEFYLYPFLKFFTRRNHSLIFSKCITLCIKTFSSGAILSHEPSSVFCSIQLFQDSLAVGNGASCIL